MTAKKIISSLIMWLCITSAFAQYEWSNVRVGGGGAVPGMIAHPKVKDLFYIRTDVGNPYRWDAKTEKWVGLLNNLKNSDWWLGAAADIAIDPSDITGNIVYAAVGKYDWAGNGRILKSTDRGNTWSTLNLSVSIGSNQDQKKGQRLAISPFNSRLIIYTSKSDGTFKTSDGGLNWKKVSTINGSFVVFDPSNSNVVYLGHSAGVMKSINSGETFLAMSNAPTNCRRASMHTSGSMYVTTESSVNKWNGSNWTNISPDGFAVYGAIAVNPQNVNHVIVSKHAWNHNLDMYISSNAGSNWIKINKSRDISEVPWSPDHHFASAIFEFCWDPFDQNHVWFSDWYNTWETKNPWALTVVWKARASGHEEMVTIGALACPSYGNNILLSGIADVGGFDHISITTPPNQNIWGAGVTSGNLTTGLAFQETNTNYIVRVGRMAWDGLGWGAYSIDGGKSYISFSSIPGNGGRVAISATSNKIVWATQGGKVFYSTNNGADWTTCNGLPTDGLIGGNNVFSYCQPLAADKVNGRVFYAYCRGKFYKSTDGGANFIIENTSLPPLSNTDYVNLVAVSGKEGDIYLGLDTNGLKHSKDGGTTWSTLIAVSKARLVAVGKAGISGNPAVFVHGVVNGVEGIFRSDDNGETWIEISTDTHEIGMEPNIMAADRNAYGRVFIGTNGNGLFYGQPESFTSLNNWSIGNKKMKTQLFCILIQFERLILFY